MKRIFIFGVFVLFALIVDAQNVGIGIPTPLAKLNIVGVGSSPTIPGASTTTAIFRIGISPNEGIDFGKLPSAPFSAWIQSGSFNVILNPISLQPLGGNVGIGILSPTAKLDVNGTIKVEGLATFNGSVTILGNVGIGILSPAVSAKLELSSTTQGFLPPRMTQTQRDAIITPEEGLMIYNTTKNKPNFYNGLWRNFDGSLGYEIGDYYLGGKLAYILQPGDPGYIASQFHGLIAAAFDQIGNGQWGCLGIAIPGADDTGLGTGNQNTIDIIAGCATLGIAARICGDLVLNGFSDWYLPSKDELNKLYINRAMVGGFLGTVYWSSSEVDGSNAWFQNFLSGGIQNFNPKNNNFNVRAIRAF